MEPPPYRQSTISSAFLHVIPKPGGFTAKGTLIPSRRVSLAGFTCSSPIAMPHMAALLLHLETAGHGLSQHSHQKAEKLRAAQPPVVGQTEAGGPHTSGSQRRHNDALAGQGRLRGSDPAAGSGLQPDQAPLHPSMARCAGTGSVTLAIQVQSGLNA